MITDKDAFYSLLNLLSIVSISVMNLFAVNKISLILYCGFNSYYNYNRPRERHSDNFISLESQYLNVSKENKLTSFPASFAVFK